MEFRRSVFVLAALCRKRQLLHSGGIHFGIAETERLSKPKSPLKPNTEIIGNYEVESEFPTLTPEEQKEREKAAIRLIAETMRRQKRK